MRSLRGVGGDTTRELAHDRALVVEGEGEARDEQHHDARGARQAHAQVVPRRVARVRERRERHDAKGDTHLLQECCRARDRNVSLSGGADKAWDKAEVLPAYCARRRTCPGWTCPSAARRARQCRRAPRWAACRARRSGSWRAPARQRAAPSVAAAAVVRPGRKRGRSNRRERASRRAPAPRRSGDATGEGKLACTPCPACDVQAGWSSRRAAHQPLLSEAFGKLEYRVVPDQAD